MSIMARDEKVYAYRFLDAKDANHKVGETLQGPFHHFISCHSKRAAEEIFEQVRSQSFPNTLSRETSLFVVPHDIAYVENWMNHLYPHENHDYNLLLLELDGTIEWHNGELFSDTIFYKDSTKYTELAMRYLKEEYETVTNNKQAIIDGLFQGRAKIIEITQRHHYAMY